MNRLILLLLLFIPAIGFGQSITKSKIDKFTKLHEIETSYVKISGGGWGLFKNVWVSLRSSGDKVYLNVKWNTHEIIGVPEGAILTFLSKDDEQFKFVNRHREVSTSGAGTVGFVGSLDYGVNLYFDGDVMALDGVEITDFRMETTDGYVDFTPLLGTKKKLDKLFNVFKKETTKNN